MLGQSCMFTVSTKQLCWAVAEDRPASLHEAALVPMDPVFWAHI